MSNRYYNKQTANCRSGSTAKLGSYGRGKIEIPKAIEAAAITTKGVVPAAGKAKEISISKGQEKGTALGMGAATKGGNYTWS